MAAFYGKPSPEWSGPKNPLGRADFHIYQNNRPVQSLAAALAAGGEFTVVWYYDASEAEIAKGMEARTAVAEVFGPKSDYLHILGVMYALRREKLTAGDFDSGPALNLGAFSN